jgi:hypothetical protein
MDVGAREFLNEKMALWKLPSEAEILIGYAA